MNNQLCYILWCGVQCNHDDFYPDTSSLEEISFDENKLLTLKAELENKQVQLHTLYDNIHNIRNQFNQTRQDVRPVLDQNTIKKIPKWKVGLRKQDITQEMRDHRKQIEFENNEVYQLHAQKVYAYEEICDIHIRNQLNLPADFELNFDTTNYTWKITSKELI